MKFVEDEIEYIPQESGIDGIYKMMELAARQCYLTNDLIKEGSAQKIIDNVCIKNGHTSVTEFGTVYLVCSIDDNAFWSRYNEDRFSRLVFDDTHVYITTTFRTILQGDYDDPIEAIKNQFDKNWKNDLIYMEEPSKHLRRYCIRFTMDRVGSQSVERHRGVWGISYAQESTRYVNYAKEKFGNDILISLPSKFYSLIEKYEDAKKLDLDEQIGYLYDNDNGWKIYVDTLKNTEKSYFDLIGEGWKPEDARGVLNLDIKTQFMMCGYKEDWNMWLFRRTEKHAHLHIQSISKRVKDILDNVYKEEKR